MGGVVWGIGMGLMEESVLDEHIGRVVNANLAEYHVPTNADIGLIDVQVVTENDPSSTHWAHAGSARSA